MYGRHQDIPVSSSPTGAEVYLDGDHVGTTPCTLNVRRGARHIVTLQHPDYQHENVVLEPVYSCFELWNWFFVPIVGTIYDISRGTAYFFEPDVVIVTLAADPPQ